MKTRKVEFIIAGILAICGCAMIIVGTVMGGRPGSFFNVDGRLIYQNSRESIVVSNTPFWLSGIDRMGIFELNITSLNAAEEETGFDTVHEGNGSGGEERESGKASIYNGTSQTITSGETLDIGGYDKFEIEVDYGYVTIESGSSPELRVEGELSVNVSTDDGFLKIESENDGKGISKKIIGGITRFYKNGKDITTELTIVLPNEFDELDVKLGAGAMDISSLNTLSFSADVELGAIEISDVSSISTAIEVDMGTIRLKNHSTETADLSCNLGAIEFSGHVADYFEAECSLGSIEATVAQPSSYGYDIENNLGNVSLDGKTFSVNSDSEQEGAGTMFDLKCDLGSIIVKFDESRV